MLKRAGGGGWLGIVKVVTVVMNVVYGFKYLGFLLVFAFSLGGEASIGWNKLVILRE